MRKLGENLYLLVRSKGNFYQKHLYRPSALKLLPVVCPQRRSPASFLESTHWCVAEIGSRKLAGLPFSGYW